MFKKFIVGLLLLMGIVCFADYKSDFNWNLTDSAKIEKGLAEATTAKDKNFIASYGILKSFLNKDASNLTYEQFKATLRNDANIIASKALQISRFNPFIKNVINDNSVNNCYYFKAIYSRNVKVCQSIGFKVWKEKFINLTFLKKITSINTAKGIIKCYERTSDTLTTAEIKADCAIFKRAWYTNITVSDEWKQLLVKIELMQRSVQ